ncbi:hypothetical protein [Actinacidiphila oryziradicis]|uniref:hypothetical protein n=1 Tax=Actinacidiphila oryziradicis TaxID=2571141 RepID=UPI0023EFBED8|nr:hypothetical protein [Actinacidiphila oryziradicis]MCW2875199.1 hypothetical protein [Actinacidiphila oryziradicis]
MQVRGGQGEGGGSVDDGTIGLGRHAVGGEFLLVVDGGQRADADAGVDGGQHPGNVAHVGGGTVHAAGRIAGPGEDPAETERVLRR